MVGRVLVIYKRTAYQMYMEGRRKPSRKRRLGLGYLGLAQLKSSHAAHYQTLDEVQRCLRSRKIPHTVILRGHAFNEGRYDLVVTVGGDGTLLESARRIRDRLMVGVNSHPGQSVGKLCLLTGIHCARFFDAVLRGRVRAKRLNRIQPKLNGRVSDIRILNDALISHPNPAAMTHYGISIGRRHEEHRGSGLWISTAAGSTGAIQSAGARALPLESRKIQYLPRELYPYPRRRPYRLKGGALPSASLMVRCLSENARIYVDGEKFHLSFSYGDVLRFVESRHPLRILL